MGQKIRFVLPSGGSVIGEIYGAASIVSGATGATRNAAIHRLSKYPLDPIRLYAKANPKTRRKKEPEK